MDVSHPLDTFGLANCVFDPWCSYESYARFWALTATGIARKIHYSVQFFYITQQLIKYLLTSNVQSLRPAGLTER